MSDTVPRTLAGKVAIVSGAGEGIGRSCALAFARDGADVALGARRPEQLERVADEVRALGRRALTVPTDVAEPAQCRELVSRTVAELGRVDAVVNVAALSDAHTTVEDTDWEVFRRVFEVNVIGTLEVSRAAIGPMRAAGGGSIVQISSTAMRSRPAKQAPYASTKSALVVASQVLAREAGPDNVRVNVVVPGYVTGPHLDALFATMAERRGQTVEEIFAEAASLTALGRIPSPDDVAEAVLFLASGRGAGITGVTLDVNAGLWIG
ncbi:MAG TPA: SDR family oxidoreductase [Acidimicrobiia bacterium]|jgi:NAD(P)-dependent dehydrogenase (short-subunit alcohol dehydrogenase family)